MTSESQRERKRTIERDNVKTFFFSVINFEGYIFTSWPLHVSKFLQRIPVTSNQHSHYSAESKLSQFWMLIIIQ